MVVNILGTEYTVTVKKYDEDEVFARLSIDGYCDSWTKQIVARRAFAIMIALR